MADRRFSALAQIRRRAEVGEGAYDDSSPLAEAPSVQPDPPVRPAPPAPAAQAANAAPLRPPGRPPGKRSDPDWKPKTILMKTRTHKRVSAVLLERDDGPDLSELVEELLSAWLTKQ